MDIAQNALFALFRACNYGVICRASCDFPAFLDKPFDEPLSYAALGTP
jgi:hypothetical protein